MNVRLVIVRLFTALLIAGAAGPATATTTYHGTLTIGGSSAVYDIITDGTQGVLSDVNLLGNSMMVSQGGNQISFVNGNNFRTIGTSLSAEGNKLLFDTTGNGLFIVGNIFGFGPRGYFTGVCFRALAAACGGGTPYLHSVVAYAFDTNYESKRLFGSVVVGTSVVPDPAAWTLMTIGFAAIGAMRRRRPTGQSV